MVLANASHVLNLEVALAEGINRCREWFGVV